jgi:hypothetical protein
MRRICIPGYGTGRRSRPDRSVGRRTAQVNLIFRKPRGFTGGKVCEVQMESSEAARLCGDIHIRTRHTSMKLCLASISLSAASMNEY